VAIDSAGIVVVLTALDTEHEAVRAHLRDPRRHPHPAGTVFEVGGLEGQPGTIALAVVGVGNQAAAALTERAITGFRPRAVLFVGIAGALHDDLDLGTIVVATKVYGHHGGTDETGGFLVRPQSWDADHELDQLAREVNRTGSWKRLLRAAHNPPAVYFRPIAAGEVVLNSRETPLAKQLQENYADAAAIEMESAGMAKAAHLNRTPFLTIRGISDKADGRKYSADHEGAQLIAAANAAAFAIAVARSVLDPGTPPQLVDELQGAGTELRSALADATLARSPTITMQATALDNSRVNQAGHDLHLTTGE
jgi:nucleoside phosphorylase